MSGHHPIPAAALDDRLGFVGTAGSGKTYNAGSAVERLLDRKARVVIIDPLGVWWGLRLRADGKASGFDVAIFGGPHGDLPLNEHAGALIGETAATMAESCIVDLSELGTKSAERRFMTAFLETIYRKSAGALFHLVVDEADMFAPQKPPKGDETLLNLMEQIVRRGRVKGFIPWLITQRPAVINKNVLSQVDGLIAFKLTASQDRDALDAWIEGQADKGEGRAIKDSLPTLQIGTGVIWVPGRGVLETKSFPLKVTFDSSRAPKRGERVKRTAALRPLDLGALKERLVSIETEKKASDPKALRAEIARLTAELTKAGKSKSVPADPDAIAKAEERGFEQAKRKLAAAAEKELKVRVGAMMTALRSAGDAFAADVKEIVASAAGSADLKDGVAFMPAPSPVLRAAPSLPPRMPARAKSSAPAGDETISGPLQAIIDAIRWWNVLGVDAPSHAQAAFVAGYSHKSGTWSTYLSRLRSLGLIEGRGDLALTPEGAAVAREPSVPPTDEHLRATVRDKLDSSLRRILSPILEAYPSGLSHQEAADLAGYSAQSGTWSTYLSRLRSLDLIDARGELKAQDWLFPRARAA